MKKRSRHLFVRHCRLVICIVGTSLTAWLLITGCSSRERTQAPPLHELPLPHITVQQGHKAIVYTHTYFPSAAPLRKIDSTSDTDQLYTVPEKKILTYHTRAGQESSIHFTDQPLKIWMNTTTKVQFLDAPVTDSPRIWVQGEVLIDRGPSTEKMPIILSNRVLCRLGTGELFVNNYPDEEYTTITLLEGNPVTIQTPDDKRVVLSFAGESVAFDGKGKVLQMFEKDTSYVRELTRGALFAGTLSTQQLMKRITRWYAIPVRYLDAVDDRSWSGILSKQRNLSKNLDLINASMAPYMSCTIINDTIVVSSLKQALSNQ